MVKMNCLTFTSRSSTLYTLLKWSRPSVELRSLVDTNVLLVNRRNIELLPAPNSPHRINFCSGTLVVAMTNRQRTNPTAHQQQKQKHKAQLTN